MWAVLQSWLTGNAVKLMAYGAAALSVVAVLFGARQSGRNAERVDELNKILEIKNAQLRAAAYAPSTRTDLIDLLQRGKF